MLKIKILHPEILMALRGSAQGVRLFYRVFIFDLLLVSLLCNFFWHALKAAFRTNFEYYLYNTNLIKTQRKSAESRLFLI